MCLSLQCWQGNGGALTRHLPTHTQPPRDRRLLPAWTLPRYVRLLRHPIAAVFSHQLTDFFAPAHASFDPCPAELVGLPFKTLYRYFPGEGGWVGWVGAWVSSAARCCWLVLPAAANAGCLQRLELLRWGGRVQQRQAIHFPTIQLVWFRPNSNSCACPPTCCPTRLPRPSLPRPGLQMPW